MKRKMWIKKFETVQALNQILQKIKELRIEQRKEDVPFVKCVEIFGRKSANAT